MSPPEQSRAVFDTALGAGAASLPFWALQTQNWAIFIAAVAGAALAVCRLVQFIAERRRGKG